MVMNRLAKVLFAPIIATVVGGTPLMPTPAEAAKTPRLPLKRLP
jgi:hypothetical protein